MRARPRAAPARPRARDHAGLAAARAGGRLRHLRRPLRRHARRRARAAAVPARARRQLPAPDAAAGRAARSPTTAATRSPTTARSSRRWARWTTCARSPATCTRTGWRCASTSSSTTRRASTRGRGGAGRRRAQARLLPHVPGPHRARRLRAHAARGLPRHRARQLLLGARARPLGVDDVQRLPVGPRLHEPRGVPRDGGGRPRARRTSGVDVLRLDAVPFLWKRKGTDCQNQPEVHELLQALRAVPDRGAAVAFKAEAIVSAGAARHLPRDRAATRARSATSPTTTC